MDFFHPAFCIFRNFSYRFGKTQGVNRSKIEIQTLYEVMFTDYPDIVNVAQVQAMLGISRHLAYALIGDGDIPGMKIGNAYRVPKINVIRYALGGKSAAGGVAGI